MYETNILNCSTIWLVYEYDKLAHMKSVNGGNIEISQDLVWDSADVSCINFSKTSAQILPYILCVQEVVTHFM